MAEQARIIDHDQIIAAARVDAGREGARVVKMTLGDLWSLIHRAPTLSATERGELSEALRPR